MRSLSTGTHITEPGKRVNIHDLFSLSWQTSC